MGTTKKRKHKSFQKTSEEEEDCATKVNPPSEQMVPIFMISTTDSMLKNHRLDEINQRETN